MACTEPRPPGNVIVVGMTNSATNLDPRVGTDEASQKIHQLIFNTLVHIDNQLRVVPELAESIEHPDPITYIARLRHGVLFHNGRELTVGGRRLHVPKFSRSGLQGAFWRLPGARGRRCRSTPTRSNSS